MNHATHDYELEIMKVTNPRIARRSQVSTTDYGASTATSHPDPRENMARRPIQPFVLNSLGQIGIRRAIVVGTRAEKTISAVLPV